MKKIVHKFEIGDKRLSGPEMEQELPIMALGALYRILKSKKTTQEKLNAAIFVLKSTVWREAPKQELHLHITAAQIEDAKRKAGLLVEAN